MKQDPRLLVDLDDLVSGGPGRNGIPPIDRPELVPCGSFRFAWAAFQPHIKLWS